MEKIEIFKDTRSIYRSIYLSIYLSTYLTKYDLCYDIEGGPEPTTCQKITVKPITTDNTYK